MEWNLLFFFNSALLGAGLAMDAFSVSLANGLNEPAMSRRKMCGIAGTFAAFQAFMPMTGWLCVHTVVQYFQIFEKFIPWIALVLLVFIGGKMLVEGTKRNPENQDCLLDINSPAKQDCLSDKRSHKNQDRLLDINSPAKQDCLSDKRSQKKQGRLSDKHSHEKQAVSSDNSNAAGHPVGGGALFVQGVATSIDALSVGFAIADYSPAMALVCSLVIAAVTFLICMAGLRIGKKFGTRLSGKAAILGGAILIVIGLEIFITGVF
ncbi:MAG: manganese efflux pump MntP family protein [Clostridium sp.]|nr:manganese efflux pump MntP family protein [Clostridium sp.]